MNSSLSSYKSSESINQLHESEYRWFAVYTKYKAEKYIYENLKNKGITAFLPLLKKTKIYASKKKQYEVPLINCYVFVKIIKSQYVQVLETEYVLKFLKQRKDLLCIPEAEINLLQRIVGENISIKATPEEFKIGEAVEVIKGNLTGLKGILVEQRGKKEFLVSINSIGIQMSIGIDPDYLMPVIKNN